ncbi:hypothetical protein OIU84_008539 [Salix udensis]|uniref:Uncharacterized protein n=1 Tax=Salix udensis TaxID=889485 RepID=A0AAD6JPQ4_9ROSI|nr:hypothetical protein OIU84_008539 [Salix udensis]
MLRLSAVTWERVQSCFLAAWMGHMSKGDHVIPELEISAQVKDQCQQNAPSCCGMASSSAESNQSYGKRSFKLKRFEREREEILSVDMLCTKQARWVGSRDRE